MSTFIVLTDSAGRPRDSIFEVSDWTRFDAAKLRDLAVAAWPAETVLGVEWAAEPRKYSPVAKTVLLVRCAGVVERAEVRRPARAPARRAAADELEMADEVEMLGSLAYRAGERWRVMRTTAPAQAPVALDDVVVINTCTCCERSYTAASWAQLELLGAKEHTEENTVIHEDYRRCLCGSTRMVFHTRPRAERGAA